MVEGDKVLFLLVLRLRQRYSVVWRYTAFPLRVELHKPHIKRRTSMVALRVFGREVFNGQLPSNALAIHVTMCFIFIVN
jgi:hypothetical protein